MDSIHVQDTALEVTRCVCETQMPPIMAHTKDGDGHKDRYLDTSRKIGRSCHKKLTHVQYESCNIYG